MAKKTLPVWMRNNNYLIVEAIIYILLISVILFLIYQFT
jgi:hypothetical protein